MLWGVVHDIVMEPIDNNVTSPTFPLTWEVTREEWRQRYGAYARIAVPLAIGISLSALVFFYLEDALLIGATLITVAYLATGLYLYYEYRSHPVRVTLYDSHIVIEKQSGTQEYPWTDFAGYIDGSKGGFAQAKRAARGSSVVSQGQAAAIDATVEKGRAIIGTFYYLMRPWPRWHPFPYSRAVVIGVEPEAGQAAAAVLREKLQLISVDQVQKNIDRAGLVLGLVIGATAIIYGLLRY